MSVGSSSSRGGRSTSWEQDRILHAAAQKIMSIGTAHDVAFFGTDMAGLANFIATEAGNCAAVATLSGNTAGAIATGSAAIGGPIGYGISAPTTILFGLRRFAKTAAHWGMLREIATAKVVECTCRHGSIRCPHVLAYIINQKRNKGIKAIFDCLLAPAPGAMVLYRISRATWKAVRGEKGRLRRNMAASLYWAARGHSSTREGKPLKGRGEPCPMAVEVISQLFCGSPFSMLMRDAIQGNDSEYGEYGHALKETEKAQKIVGQGEERAHRAGANKPHIDLIFQKLAT